MSYMVNGRQFVAVTTGAASGPGAARSGTMRVFALRNRDQDRCRALGSRHPLAASRQQFEMGRGAGRGLTSSRRTIAGLRSLTVAFAGRNGSVIVDTMDAASNRPKSKVAARTKFLNGVRIG